MKRIVTLYPDRLNLNGDQGNVLALEKRLSAYGLKTTVIDFEIGDNSEILQDADLLFLGHGSQAAWASLGEELQRITPNLCGQIRDKRMILGVASGAEFLLTGPLKEVLGTTLEHTERSSKFVTYDFEGFSVLGYINSTAKIPAIQRLDSIILTTMHGPVLGKNPKLADWILSELGVNVVHNAVTDYLDKEVSGIWALEEPLANQ